MGWLVFLKPLLELLVNFGVGIFEKWQSDQQKQQLGQITQQKADADDYIKKEQQADTAVAHVDPSSVSVWNDPHNRSRHP